MFFEFRGKVERRTERCGRRGKEKKVGRVGCLVGKEALSQAPLQGKR